jgi:hypothetical protein
LERSEIGSYTAKGGFANERAICKKFNEWKNDKESQLWLQIMGYDIVSIESVEAMVVPTRFKREFAQKIGVKESYEDLLRFKKADAQIRVIIKMGNILKIENLSLKKANSDADYNQVDKRSVDSYKEMWGFDDEIAFALKLFTGEISPFSQKSIKISEDLRDKRRLFLDELPPSIKDAIISFFEKNKILVVSDIIKGRGGLSADWMLVTRYDKSTDETKWTLKDINTTMNHFGGGEVSISKKGSLRIGKIVMQRKGGTPDPTKIQFKINPCSLFEAK